MGMRVRITSNHRDPWSHPLLSEKPSNLIQQLDHYRRRTEQLSRLCELHKRLTSQADLASMLGAFSGWLNEHIAHDMVVYRHFQRRHSHMACSRHGPERAQLLQLAERLMAQPETTECSVDLDQETGLYYHMSPVDLANNTDRILVIFRGPHVGLHGFCPLLREIRRELKDPLERAMLYEELYEQARCDTLTGLVNRRVFEERLHQEVENASRYGNGLILAALDLDHFKAVNDQLGHGAGDDALRDVARVLQKEVRGADLLARVGGDEFALILPNASLAQATGLSQRLCRAVAALEIQAPHAPPLGVSIGLSHWNPGQSAEALAEQADAALYRAKAAGRSTVAA
jgi:diguanylate cyclase (GGDEF)-like protein